MILPSRPFLLCPLMKTELVGIPSRLWQRILRVQVLLICWKLWSDNTLEQDWLIMNSLLNFHSPIGDRRLLKAGNGM